MDVLVLGKRDAVGDLATALQHAGTQYPLRPVVVAGEHGHGLLVALQRRLEIEFRPFGGGLLLVLAVLALVGASVGIFLPHLVRDDNEDTGEREEASGSLEPRRAALVVA